MSNYVDPFADPAAQEDSTYVDPFAESTNQSSGAGLSDTVSKPKQNSSADKFAAEIMAREETNKPKDEPGALGNSGRALSAGAVSATGFGVRGIGELMREGGEPLAAGLNAVFDTHIFKAENPVLGVAKFLETYGEEIKEGMSASARKAMEDSTPTGDITTGEDLSFGKDPSVEGYIYQTLNVFGQLAPVLLTAYATRGQSLKAQMGISGGVAGVMGGGGGASEEGDRIRKLTPEQLENVPLYIGLVNEGMSHEDAVEDVATASEIGAFRWTAPVSVATGLSLGYVMSKPGQALLSKLVGKSMPARMGAGAAAVGSEEGVQEVIEGIASKRGEAGATGEERNLTEDSFGNAVLGFLGGSGAGAAGGLSSIDDEQDNTAADPSQEASQENPEAPTDGTEQVVEPSAETLDDSDVIPTQEAPETLVAQMTAVMDGRKPAMLFTPGEQIPEDMSEDLASFDLGPKVGMLVYPRSTPEVLTQAQAEVSETGMVSGTTLGYGVEGKAADSDTVITARDADGTVIQDVGDDGSQGAMDAAQQMAGENGSVEERPVQDAHIERESAQPNDIKQQKEELRQQFRDGEIDNDQFSKAIAEILKQELAENPRIKTPVDQPVEETAPVVEDSQGPSEEEMADMGQSDTGEESQIESLDDGSHVRWSEHDAGDQMIMIIDDGDLVYNNASITKDDDGTFTVWGNSGEESISNHPTIEEAISAGEIHADGITKQADIDRRHDEKSVDGENRSGSERRDNDVHRKEVDDMSFDERGTALLTDQLIDMRNRRAYDESEKKTFQVSIDVDSLKFVNDEMGGHGSGDFILNEVGLALKKEFGDEAYRMGGDEFTVQGAMKPQLVNKLESVLEALSKVDLVVELPDGKRITLKGIGFSYGISNTLKDADNEMLKQKTERTEQGLRANPEVRGGRPPNAIEETTEGQQDSGVDELPTEEEGISDADFDAMLDEEMGVDDDADSFDKKITAIGEKNNAHGAHLSGKSWAHTDELVQNKLKQYRDAKESSDIERITKARNSLFGAVNTGADLSNDTIGLELEALIEADIDAYFSNVSDADLVDYIELATYYRSINHSLGNGKFVTDGAPNAAFDAAFERGLIDYDGKLIKSDEPQVNTETESGKLDESPLTDEDIDAAAHEAATSPQNDKKEPSQNQKDAENYELGDTIDLHGIKVRVENPRDSYRFKVDQNALREIVENRRSTSDNSDYADYNKVIDLLEKTLKLFDHNSTVPEAFAALEEAHKLSKKIPAIQELLDVFMLPENTGDPKPYWFNKMRAHYGKILGTVGADGDHVDVFMGRNAADPTKTVFVIDQINPETGKFDEHKVMVGYSSLLTARLGYLANYDKNWKGMGGITAMTFEELVAWTKSDDTVSPISADLKAETKPEQNKQSKADLAYKKRLKDLTAAMEATNDPLEELAILDGISKKTDRYDELYREMESLFNAKKFDRRDNSDINNIDDMSKVGTGTIDHGRYVNHLALRKAIEDAGWENTDGYSYEWYKDGLSVSFEDGELSNWVTVKASNPFKNRNDPDYIFNDLDGDQAFSPKTIAETALSTVNDDIDKAKAILMSSMVAGTERDQAIKFIEDSDITGDTKSETAPVPDIKKGSVVEFTGDPESVQYGNFSSDDADITKATEIVVLNTHGVQGQPEGYLIAAVEIKYKNGGYDLADIEVTDLKIKADKPANKKKSKKPSLIDRLENYFQPNRIIKSYGGTDRVIKFNRVDSGAGWTVDVVEVDGDGKDTGHPRMHVTQPSEKLLKMWEMENPLKVISKEEASRIEEERSKAARLAAVPKPPRADKAPWTEDELREYLDGVGKDRKAKTYNLNHGTSKPHAVVLRNMGRAVDLPIREKGVLIGRNQLIEHLMNWAEGKKYYPPEPTSEETAKKEAAHKADLSVRSSLSAAVEADTELLDVTREWKSGADIKPFLLDFIAGWVEKAGVAAENNKDEHVLAAIDSMTGDGLAGLNSDRFNDEFIQGQYEMLEAANNRHDKKSKKKPKSPARNSLADASAEELVTRLNSIEDSDKAEEFVRGWDHAISGGSMSNLEGKTSQQIRIGYQDALEWMKDEKRSTKGKKQGSTGTPLRRAMDGLKNIKGGVEAELDAIYKLTTRGDLFDYESSSHPDATPGVHSYFDFIRNSVFPFKEWYGNDIGGSRRRWRRSFSEAISDQYSEDPESVTSAAQGYMTGIEALLLIFKDAKTVNEAITNFESVMYSPQTEEQIKYNWRDLSDTGSIFQKMFRYSVDRANHNFTKSQPFVKDEHAEYKASSNKTIPLVRPRLDQIMRSGMKDPRKTKNISNKEFKKVFGFTDITVGESVTAKEEQDHINYAYDAFMSLAETLGLTPKDMSLGGWLHFSVGALGHGKFAAHFSPNHPVEDGGTVAVINLTNKNGNGALAHEWFHALDERIAVNSGHGSKGGRLQSDLVDKIVDGVSYLPPNFDSATKSLKRFWKGSRYPALDRKAGRNRSYPAIRHAMYALEENVQDPVYAMQKTDYLHDALLLDNKNKKKPYWSNHKELFARAGEAYIYDKMLESKAGDNYLVSDWVEAGKTTKPSYRGKPYPDNEERRDFFDLFDSMFKAIEWNANGPRISDDWDAETASTYDQKAFKEKLKIWVKEYDDQLKNDNEQAYKDQITGWKGGTDLALKIYRAIDAGTAPKDNRELRKFVAEIDGKKVDDTRLKHAQEDFESALVQRAAHLIKQARLSVQSMNIETSSTIFSRLRDDMVINSLLNMYKNQPLLNMQTTTSSNNQAYSTPAPLAYLVSRLMGMDHNTNEGDRVYEPAAGNGMLLIDSGARNNVVNEIDERRSSALDGIYSNTSTQVYTGDALTNEAPSNIDFVITNPPFGALNTPVQFDGYKLAKIDQVIAARALEAMNYDGSAALILGANKAAGEISTTDRIFFNWLYSNYNVSEHFEVSGDMYTRQGASWPVRVIIIHGKKPSDNVVSPKNGSIERINNYEELYDKYQQSQYGDVVPNIIESSGQTAGNGDPSTGRPNGDELPGSTGGSSSNASGSNAGGSGKGSNRGPSNGGQSGNSDGNSGLGNGDSKSGSDTNADSGSDGIGSDNGGSDNAGSGGSSSDGISDEDFESMLDDELGEIEISEEEFDAEIEAVEKEKTDDRKAELVDGWGWMVPMRSASEQNIAELVDGWGWMIPVSSLEKPPPKKPKKKTATDHLKDAGKSAASANSSAWSGLDQLFGTKGKLGSGLSFDEETYAKAKPFFKKAMQEAIASGKSLKEALRSVIQMAIKAYGAAVKPYLIRFNKDITSEIKDGKIDKKGHPVKNGSDSEFQVDYETTSGSGGITTLTPTNQATAVRSALAKLEAEHGNIDEFLMSELQYDTKEALYDALMGHQVDGVAMAIYQLKHEKALIIGDQTGVGKGRQAASIIRWAKINGFTPIFITAKHDLYTAMHEDLEGIGSSELVPLITNAGEAVVIEDGNGNKKRLFANKPAQLKKDIEHMIDIGTLPEGKDMLYTTYDQLKPAGDNKINPRHDVIRSLAGNAVFILDESHKASGKSGVGSLIQEALALSGRATYLSATYAKRPDSMPVYFLTDLSLAADSMDDMISAIDAGGVPLMEIVSAQLTESGQFVRRELSWDSITIPTWIDPDEKQQKIDEGISDQVTERLRAIVSADRMFHDVGVEYIQDNLEEIGGSLLDNISNFAEASVNHSHFTSVVHNAIAQMTLAIKADRTAVMAIEALERGEKPVIALDSTMGSFLADYTAMHKIEKGDKLEGFDYRVVLGRLLRRTRRITVIDKKGKKSPVEIPLDMLPVEVQERYEEAAKLIEEMDAEVSASPIDRIRLKLEEAGYSVKEVTGRKDRVDYSTNPPTYISMSTQEKNDRVTTVSEFNNGGIDAVILNVAGAQGISMHAAEKFKDTRPRHMIVAQAALDINTFMQMLGRVNRNGQIVNPIFTLFSTSLPAEKRPMAVTAGKMKKLNANTSSNETSATSVDAVDMMNKYGDEVIARFLHENIEFREFISVDYDVTSDPIKVDDVAKKTTGQLALLPVEMQRDFYERVEADYIAYIDYLNETGRNELVAKDIDFKARVVSERTLYEGTDNNNPFTSDSVLGLYSVKRQGFPPKPEEVRKALKLAIPEIDFDQAGGVKSGYSKFMEDMINPARQHFVDKIIPVFKAKKLKAFEALSDLEKAQTGDGKQIIASSQSKKADAYNHTFEIESKQIDRMTETLEMLHDNFTIGSKAVGVTVGKDSGQVSGVIVDVAHKWDAKSQGNPFAPSRFMIKIMLNSSQYQITLPMSAMNRLVDSFSKNSNIDAIFSFSGVSEEMSRESRYIVTGNLMRAYSELERSGDIIRFTKIDNTVSEGILLPQDFNPAEDIKLDEKLSSPAKAAEFLRRNALEHEVKTYGISTRDKTMTVRPADELGGVTLMVTGSATKGGKWWQNTKLTKIIGHDFAGNKKSKSVEVPAVKVNAVMEFIFNEAPLFTLPSMGHLTEGFTTRNGGNEKSPATFFSRSRSRNQQLDGTESVPSVKRNVSGVKKEDVQAVVDKTTANWKDAPAVEVVQSITDLPQNMQDDINESSEGVADPEGIEGIFDTGRTKVWIIADEISTADTAQRVLIHEAVGHYGIRRIFGSDLQSVLRQVSLAKKEEMQEIAERYGLDLTKDEDRMIAAEEVLAHMAEEGKQDNFLKRAISAIREWLRDHGLDIKLNDMDIQNIIAQARKAVFTGKKANVDGITAMSRRSKSDGFKKWFADSKVVDDNGAPLVVYHGTAKRFDSFDKDKIGSNYGVDEEGFFFSSSKEDAEYSATESAYKLEDDSAEGLIVSAYLSIKNPLIITVGNEYDAEFGKGNATNTFDQNKSSILADVDDGGHDGLIVIGNDEFGSIYMVFEPNQIKSAVENNGSYSQKSDNIRFSRKRDQNEESNQHLKSLLGKMGKGEKDTLATRAKNMFKNIIATRKELSDRMIQATFDQFHGLKIAERALDVAYDSSAYVAARMSTSIDSQLMVAMTKGPLRWLGNRATFSKNQKGLLDILQPVEDRIELWEAYMVAKRSERLMAEGKENLLTPEEIEAGMALLDTHPEFATVAAEWAKFNKTMLDFAQDAGLINKESRAIWEHDDYIPFYRILDEEKSKGPKGKRGMSHQASGIHELKGGKAQLNDILENMVMNTSHLLSAAMKNHAMQMTVTNLEGSGLIRPAPYQFSLELIPMSQFRKVLEEQGVDPKEFPSEMLEGMRKMYAMKIPTDRNVIRVMRDGKAEFYYVDDPLLLRSLTSIDQVAWGAWMEVFRAPKRWLTNMVTADPAFQAANFVRDTLQAFVLSRDNVTPIISGFKGIKKALSKDESYWEMLSAGGGFHSGFVNSHDPGASARIIKAEMRHKDFQKTVLDSPIKLWDRWQEFGSAVENANRIAVYDGALMAGKTKLAAAYEAKDFMDFSMRGDYAIFNFLAQTVPFFNARLQGIYRLGRGIHENPTAFATRGTLIAIASLALWAVNKDDDRYKELQEWDKDTYWHFWVGKEHFRFPKPFEVGFVFGTLPERMFDAMYQDEDPAGKKIMERILWNMTQVFNLGALPQTLGPIAEQIANRDFFRDSPIVGPAMDGLPEEQQYTQWTHKTSIKIGQELGISPARIDHILRGYFGTIGDYALSASDIMVKNIWDFPDAPAMRVEDFPVVKRFYRGSDPQTSRYANEYWDMLKELDKTYKGIKDYQKYGDNEKAKALYEKEKEAMEVLPLLKSAKSELSKIRRNTEFIHRTDTMTPDEKREKLNMMAERKNAIYKTAVIRAKKINQGK